MAGETSALNRQGQQGKGKEEDQKATAKELAERRLNKRLTRNEAMMENIGHTADLAVAALRHRQHPRAPLSAQSPKPEHAAQSPPRAQPRAPTGCASAHRKADIHHNRAKRTRTSPRQVFTSRTTTSRPLSSPSAPTACSGAHAARAHTCPTFPAPARPCRRAPVTRPDPRRWPVSAFLQRPSPPPRPGRPG